MIPLDGLVRLMPNIDIIKATKTTEQNERSVLVYVVQHIKNGIQKPDGAGPSIRTLNDKSDFKTKLISILRNARSV